MLNLTSFSCLMFLNTLVKHINDQGDLSRRLRELLPIPVDEDSAQRKMMDFYDYLMELVDTGEITKRQVP